MPDTAQEVNGKHMLRERDVKRALRHLRANDAVMKDLIARVGPFTLRPQRNRFALLARSIISQQISTKAADSIRRRLQSSLPGKRLSAADVAGRPLEDLRAAGLSQRKAEYLRDLAQAVCDRRLKLRRLSTLADEDVIAELVQLRGVGRWTAQMFLIFGLGRPDILPHDDFGVRSAMRKLYALPQLPNRSQCDRIARPWRPYASVASWYCWRSFDLATEAAADCRNQSPRRRK